MRTLGIDLAAQDADTAICEIEWRAGRACVRELAAGASDAAILAAMRRADWIAIDAPFGWPNAMVAAVAEFADLGRWPAEATSSALRHRVTDRVVHDHVLDAQGVSIWPLSVSSDRIAVCAWRCARLLGDHAGATGWRLDRLGPPGPSGIAEVYPAGALAMWGLPHRGYKGGTAATAVAARERRGAILATIEQVTAPWLALPEDAREACRDDDDAFDALVAALVGRAAATGRTLAPHDDQRVAARREGWIHLPDPGSLAHLG